MIRSETPRVVRIGIGIFYGIWAIGLTGFVCHRSKVPEVFSYNLPYFEFLIAFASSSLVPVALVFFGRRLGWRNLLRTLMPTFGLGAMVYLGASVYYYQTRTYPFDPMLQVAPPAMDPGSMEKDAGVFRIVALGGSTTRNRPLPAEHRYPAQLERILAERYPNRRIEVINQGMDWYTTQHSLVNYVTHARWWQPDMVLLMHAVNDVYRSFAAPRFTNGEFDERWSHFYGAAARAWDPPSFEGRWLRKLGEWWFSDLRVTEREFAVEEFRSIRGFRRNLEALALVTKAEAAKLVLVTQPFLYEESMSSEHESRLWFGRSFMIDYHSYWNQEYPSPASLARAMRAFNDVVRETAQRHGVLLADAAPQLPKDPTVFTDDVHYTDTGARLLAESIAEVIVQAGAIEAVAP